MSSFTESSVKDAALSWLELLGYAILHAPKTALGEHAAERIYIFSSTVGFWPIANLMHQAGRHRFATSE